MYPQISNPETDRIVVMQSYIFNWCAANLILAQCALQPMHCNIMSTSYLETIQVSKIAVFTKVIYFKSDLKLEKCQEHSSDWWV